MTIPGVCDLGADRLSWVQCQVLPCLRPGTGPVDSRRTSTFHCGFISFLPLWEQSERKGLPLPSQEGGERAHPSRESSPCLVGTDTGRLSGQSPCKHYLALSPGFGGRDRWQLHISVF